MNPFLVTPLAVLVGSVTVVSPCLAERNGDATIFVGYDDLDLSTPQGAKALKQRIEITAEQTCIAAAGISPGGQMDMACRTDALAMARSQIPAAIAEQRLRRMHVAAATASPVASDHR
jgi:UrcA family protein